MNHEYIPPACRTVSASGNIVSVDKLEEILVAQWSAFINPAKLIVWTMKTVRARLDTSFIVVNDADFSNRGTQITVSRCQLKPGCFLLWIDFTIPFDDKVAVGTVETRLGFDGSLTAEAASGNLYTS